MYIKRSIIYKANESKATRNAVALLALCKDNLDVHFIENFSYNKLHKLTGLHITTLKKRVKTLLQMGLAHFEGRHFVFHKVQQKNVRNNVRFESNILYSVKEYEYAIATLCIANVQAQKNYIKKAFDILRNPKKLDEFKKAKKFIRSHGYGSEFVDNGISYATIAKKLGTSLMTACKIVKFAVEHGFLSCIHHIQQYSVKNILYMCNKDNSEFTYSTKNNVYIVNANAYELGESIEWLY